MNDQSPSIVSKVWGMCNPLRDDGLSYQDYLEQLTYLIFLKMSDEYSRPPYNRATGIPAGCGWAARRFPVRPGMTAVNIRVKRILFILLFSGLRVNSARVILRRQFPFAGSPARN